MKKPAWRASRKRSRLGGRLKEALVSIRIYGDRLEPAELTKRIGGAPTRSWRKGDLLPGRRPRTATTGMWILESAMPPTTALETQIDALLRRLTSSRRIWRALAARYTVDLFCGLFPDGEAQEVWLSARLLSRLTDRRLALGVDLYAPS